MKHIDPSPNNLSGADWSILGEVELPISVEANDVVSAWLTEILNPLSLHTDFLDKISKSAHDATARAMQAENRSLDLKHIHLLIFIPGNHSAEGHTWGFFRIEKIESTPSENSDPNHAIEFYLYGEEH